MSGTSVHFRNGAILTFSNPQNLSLPSSRRGPGGTSRRDFSRGVIWRALGSFLAGDDPADGLEVPYEICSQQFCPSELALHNPPKPR